MMFIRRKRFDKIIDNTVYETFKSCSEIAINISKRNIIENMTGKESLKYLSKIILEGINKENDND